MEVGEVYKKEKEKPNPGKLLITYIEWNWCEKFNLGFIYQSKQNKKRERKSEREKNVEKIKSGVWGGG